MHSLHVINQTAETKEKRRGKRTKKNTESVLLGIYTPHSAGMAACNDASIAFVKSTFFRGCKHPKIIRELTPSWDMVAGAVFFVEG